MHPQRSLADLANHLSKLLGGRVKLYVTRCVTWELRSMGDDMQQVQGTVQFGVDCVMMN